MGMRFHPARDVGEILEALALAKPRNTFGNSSK